MGYAVKFGTGNIKDKTLVLDEELFNKLENKKAEVIDIGEDNEYRYIDAVSSIKYLQKEKRSTYIYIYSSSGHSNFSLGNVNVRFTGDGFHGGHNHDSSGWFDVILP